MNHVVLIGNGFDLAHGLKTSYNDFLKFYLTEIHKELTSKFRFEDDNFKIEFVEKDTLDGFGYMRPPVVNIVHLADKPDLFFKSLIEKQYNVEYKSRFIKKVLNNVSQKGWVNIEQDYYETLVEIYKYEVFDKQLDAAQLELTWSNQSLSQLKKLLSIYLTKIETENSIELIPEIKQHFTELKRNIRNSANEKIMVLNFNYTSTVEIYFNEDDLTSFFRINNIHGKLNNRNNPIIFGYGDETDKNYHDIETLNNNEYLQFMKSFEYCKINNYQNIINFLDGGDYEVHIMGIHVALQIGYCLKLFLKIVFVKKYIYFTIKKICIMTIM